MVPSVESVHMKMINETVNLRYLDLYFFVSLYRKENNNNIGRWNNVNIMVILKDVNGS